MKIETYNTIWPEKSGIASPTIKLNPIIYQYQEFEYLTKLCRKETL